MFWKVCLVGNDDCGREKRFDLAELGEIGAPDRIDGVGVTLSTGRQILGGLQRAVVCVQETALTAAAQERASRGHGVRLKDYRRKKVQTIFGTVSMRVPRLIINGAVASSLAGDRFQRSTRELDEIRARLCAFMSYRAATKMLNEVFPIDGGATPTTARRVLARKAGQPTQAPESPSAPGEVAAFPLDTTFVRGIDDPLEILVGAIEPARGAAQYFAAPISMRNDCIRLGKSALEACGDRNVEAFSDSDTTVRAIAKEMGVSAKPISDWFHLAMRIRHIQSVAEALEALTPAIARANEAVREEIKKMKTALWKGKTTAVAQTIRAIGPNLKAYGDEPKCAKRAKRIKKLRRCLKKLAHYVKNPAALIVNYCQRKHDGQRLGTSLVEGAADFIVNARMAKSQHMRWSKKGAYNMLQVRTAYINQMIADRRMAA